MGTSGSWKTPGMVLEDYTGWKEPDLSQSCPYGRTAKGSLHYLQKRKAGLSWRETAHSLWSRVWETIYLCRWLVTSIHEGKGRPIYISKGIHSNSREPYPKPPQASLSTCPTQYSISPTSHTHFLNRNRHLILFNTLKYVQRKGQTQQKSVDLGSW